MGFNELEQQLKAEITWYREVQTTTHPIQGVSPNLRGVVFQCATTHDTKRTLKFIGDIVPNTQYGINQLLHCNIFLQANFINNSEEVR